MKILSKSTKRESSKRNYRTPIKVLQNDKFDTINVYKDNDIGKIRAEGDIVGASFNGPWGDSEERYYKSIGFREVTEGANEGGRSIHLDLIAKGAEIATENIASTSKLEGNNVSGSIPDKIDNFLQDVAQMTNVISYNDIIKFGKKLSQSEQYSKYALGGIEHLINKWGEALLYEDELMMDDIAYDVKSYMTFPIQKRVTKEIASESIAHIESFRLNNVVFSVMFDGDSVSIKSRHPYDEAKYHYAISNDGGHNFKIYKDYEFVENFVTKSFDCDEESGIKNFNWREIARELLRLDKNVESRIDHT